MANLDQLFTVCDAIVFLDCETSGLNSEKDRITELAVIRVEKYKGVVASFDYFIQMPTGVFLSNKITELTGITDELLHTEGKSEDFVREELIKILHSDKLTIIVAHNAHFDLQFTSMLLRGEELGKIAFLDSLTVYKDRRAYPHKLSNAIQAYGLANKVQNSHRAIDDVKALYEVVKAMDEEREDLALYINIFGYNPKYGVSGGRIKGVKYMPHYFADEIRPLEKILPALS